MWPSQIETLLLVDISTALCHTNGANRITVVLIMILSNTVELGVVIIRAVAEKNPSASFFYLP